MQFLLIKMSAPIIVTQTKPRVSEHPWRHVWVYNVYPDGTHYDPWTDYPELLNLTVHKDSYERAQKLSLKFHGLGPHPEEKKAREIVDELLSFCETDYHHKTPLQIWAYAAIQMPGDIGGRTKDGEAQAITSFASGKVLEAMCGFNSYFKESKKITEVVALDFCREMLERYEFPRRTRILYDLERVVKGEKMDFFKDGEFNTIGCWGTNYLSEELPVFREYARILAPGGKFIVLENRNEGYADLVRRYFKPYHTANIMKKAGLFPIVHPLHHLECNASGDTFYLVEGRKE